MLKDWADQCRAFTLAIDALELYNDEISSLNRCQFWPICIYYSLSRNSRKVFD